MDDGLIQFLVIGAFVVLSIIDGAARKRKAAAAEAAGHEEAAGHDEEVRPEYLRAHGTSGGDDWEQVDDFGEAGAGGFAPARPAGLEEVWEEVARLARGESAGQPLIEERYEAETMARYPVVRRSEAPVVAVEEYVRPHDDEPPHEHAVAPDVWAEDGALAAPEMPRQEAAPARLRNRTAHAWLKDGGGDGVTNLRRAIVLHEIFGPPVSLRE